MSKIDPQILKRTARGRWAEILARVAGIPSEVLDGKNRPCPKPGCGGRDRFRFTNRDGDGSVLCNQCGRGIGDGLGAVQWFTGCDFVTAVTQVAEFLGIAIERLTERPYDRSSQREIVATYDYQDADGNLIYQVVRFDPKDFRQRRPCPDGGWTYSVKDLSPDLRFLPYRMPAILASDPTQPIVVVEGEKDADACTARGIVATCNAGGAGKWRAEHAARLAGRAVIILPDNDDPGKQHAEQVARSIAGIAASVKVVALPGLPEKGDVSDYFDAGGTAEELLAFASESPEWTPGGSAPRRGGPSVITLADAARGYLDTLRSGTAELISLGIGGLDYAIGGGVERGEMILLAARPSHGKSAVALQIAHHWTASGMPCLLISEEMSPNALGKRTLQFITATAQENWPKSLAELEQELGEYASHRAPAIIVESCRTAQVAVEQIERAVEEHGVQAVIIDYAQLLNGRGKTRYEQITDVSIAIRQVTTKHKLVTLLLCQLSRAIEGREKFIPKMSDIKETGQLEQDADCIIFLCWPHRLDSERNPHEFVFFIGKNRNREIKQPAVNCQFRPSRQMVLDGEPSNGNGKAHFERHAEFDRFSGEQAEMFDDSEMYA